MQVTRDDGARVLLVTALAAASVGVAASVLGALTAGSSAAGGALVGTLICIGVFGFGLLSVHLVAAVMPMASLMVAMLTYTLQVVAMALVFAALRTSGALGSSLDPHWLAGTIIVGTVCWLVAQVVLTSRRRFPVYDLPDVGSPERPGAGER